MNSDWLSYVKFLDFLIDLKPWISEVWKTHLMSLINDPQTK